MTILAKHLYAGYKNKFIINDESFLIKENAINIFIGPNGSGKSTLFKSLCNQLKNHKGTIIIDKKLLSSYSQKEFSKKVGILFQENKIPYDITVKSLISYGRFPHIGLFNKLTDDDFKIIEEAIDLTHLKNIENSYVNELSTGQRQMVWIAMIIAQQTKYIFLDEPNSSLDLNNQFELMECMNKLKLEKNKTIILILHDINMALQYADKLFIMKNGKILKSGRPSDIIDKEIIKYVFNVNCDIKLINEKIMCSFHI